MFVAVVLLVFVVGVEAAPREVHGAEEAQRHLHAASTAASFVKTAGDTGNVLWGHRARWGGSRVLASETAEFEV